MTTPVTLMLTANNNGSTVAEFTVATTADVVAAHTELLRLARTVSTLAQSPREALPVQEQVNAVVLGEADYVTALGYTLTRKPEPVAEPEPEEAEEAEEAADHGSYVEARLSAVENMLRKFAEHFGVSL